MAGCRKYHWKRWKIEIFSDFNSQQAVTVLKNAYSFSSIANDCNYFFRKIWLRHVQTTCRSLYVMHDITALIFKWEVFVNTIKKDEKLKFQWFQQPTRRYCLKQMHIRFRPLRMRVIFCPPLNLASPCADDIFQLIRHTWHHSLAQF